MLDSEKISSKIILVIFIGLFSFFLLLNILQILTVEYAVWTGKLGIKEYIEIIKKWSEGFWKNISWALNLIFIGKESASYIKYRTKKKKKS